MRSLSDFFARYGSLFLFLFLEGICLSLIVRYNDNQKKIFSHTLSLFHTKIEKQYQSVTSYLELKQQVDRLAKENASLRAQKQIRRDIRWLSTDSAWRIDSSILFNYYEAEIIGRRSQLDQHSFILNKGYKQGIRVGMGVVADQGIVGIIQATTSNYSLVLPLIHPLSNISAKIEGRGYFGNLKWNGPDMRMTKLEAIPKHATIEDGDTIFTSGLSTIFPEGEKIGQIQHFHIPSGSNFYDIQVKLFADFYTIDHVYVVDYIDRSEIDTLRNIVGYEE